MTQGSQSLGGWTGQALRRLGLALFIASLGGTAGLAQSLYTGENYRALAADQRAFRVGDVLTVQVYENASATTSTDTTTQRQNALSAGISLLPSGKQRSGNLNVGGSFDGGGSTQRASRLLAMVSVKVIELLPNGDLKVSGEQTLTINDEKHKVHVEGRVRPQDISSDNIVLSSRLADAQINYVGDGDLSSRQRRAWWRKCLDWIGL